MAVLKNEYEISLWEDLEDIEQGYGYTQLTTKPLDWNTYYNTYFIKEWKQLTSAQTWMYNTYYSYNDNEYTLLKTKPTDWTENYSNYYEAYKQNNSNTWDTSKEYYRRFVKFKESKLGIIGSDSMTTQSRALEPCLTSNINGTNTFTFKMYYTYIDTQTGERVENSWIPLLVNEARLKVKWKSQWYDFVLKNRVEDSSGKSVTFTCEDLFTNELSKTGFNLEFDTELENNQGTVYELAKKVLADTDWTLVPPRANEITYPTVDGKKFKAEYIKQYMEEPVYQIYGAEIMGNTINGVDADTGETIKWESFSQDDSFLLFYSQVEKRPTTIQVVYSSDFIFPVDTNSLLVTRNKVHRYNLQQITWDGTTRSGWWTIKQNDVAIFQIIKTKDVSSIYRAERLVDSQKSTYDAKAQKYVSQYTDSQNSNKKTYGFIKTDYDSSLMVTNCATWSETSTEGWEGDDLYWTLYPVFDEKTNIEDYNSQGFLRIKHDQTIKNIGIQSHASFLPDGLQAGQKYHVRFHARTGDLNAPFKNGAWKIDKAGITVTLNPYNDNKKSNFHTRNYQITTVNGVKWHDITFTCGKSITQKNLSNATISIKWTGSNQLWITDFEFFREIRDSNNKIIYPGDFAAQSRTTVRYYYYYPADNTKAKSLDDISMAWVGESPNDRFKPILDPHNQKIRSISIKQSNRFNILQTIAETFQCWVKFGIGHDSNTGEIRTRGSAPELPQKYITFVNNIGEDKGYGFVYGIDLKTIQRTVASKQLVTKTIVQQNSNEFGDQGFCTIARANDNYPKTNFILNLDYFVANGLLDGEILAKDLYNKANNGLAYYVRLNEINTEYDKSLKQYIKLKDELLEQESLLDVYEKTKISTYDELNKSKNDLMKICKVSKYSDVNGYLKKNGTTDQTLAYINDISRLTNNYNNYTDVVKKLGGTDGSIAKLKAKIETIETNNKDYIQQLEDLDKAFNTKYARYLQEGSWISEDYMDDNLYYLDGLGVAYTASRPQVQYSISVLRLTALEEFKNKVFDIGDIGFIEDKEFFGYEYTDGTRTPIKEQIVVSQMASYFDSPEKDTITVQNYKTQFEDLFQRIASTTQSLQFAQGEYAKTADALNSNQTIKADLLQSSLSQNLKIMMSATNESVKMDQTGITIESLTDPNRQAKLTSGGLIFTKDGLNWTTGIDSDGMRADYLKTGIVNTNEVLIGDADSPSFRWDAKGINAYAWDQEHPDEGIIPSQFVRFDQYGMYGIKGYENFDSSGYYVPIAGYQQVTSEPQPWATTYNDYFIKNKVTKAINRVQGVAPEYSTSYYRLDPSSIYQQQYDLTEPPEWDTDYVNYFTYNAEQDIFVPITTEEAPQWQTGVYYKLIDSYDSINVPEYIDGGTYEYTTGNTDYIILENEPDDWAQTYSDYYTWDEELESFVQVEEQENPPIWYEKDYYEKIEDVVIYRPLNYKPTNWNNSYYNYFFQTEDESTGDAIFVNFSPVGEPEDWESNYFDYYVLSSGDYESVDPVAPLWDNNNEYYIQQNNPPYEAGKYYRLVDGKYQRLDSETGPTDWDTDTETVYYELLGSGLDAIENYAQFGFTWDGFFLKGDGDWISITSENGFEIFNPKWKFLSEAVSPAYDRSYKNDGEPYTVNDFIPVVSLGRFYDNATDVSNSQFSYGLRLRDKAGYVTLSTDNKGDVWSLRQLRAGNTMYNNYQLVATMPDHWSTQYTDYYTYDQTTQTYNNVIGVIPGWNNHDYWESNFHYYEWTFTQEAWKEDWTDLYFVNDAGQFEQNIDPVHYEKQYYTRGDQYFVPITTEPTKGWENVYYKYYTREWDSVQQDYVYPPVTTTAPTWASGTYYWFNDEGSIAGLNGAPLSLIDISHIAAILTKLGMVNSYEVEVENTITVGEVRRSTIEEWPYNYTPSQELPNTDWAEHGAILYYKNINDEFVLNGDALYNSSETYYTHIDMSRSTFNVINNINTTQDSDTLPIGTYYVYADNVDLSEYAVRIWAGADETYSNSRFIVFKNGYVYAQQGYFEGSIHATNGNFSGKLTIGTGEVHGIDGSEDAKYVIWSGKSTSNNVDSYEFYVDNEGKLYAQDVNIGGVINVDNGILREIFLKDDGTSGLSDGTVSMWINADRLAGYTLLKDEEAPEDWTKYTTIDGEHYYNRYYEKIDNVFTQVPENTPYLVDTYYDYIPGNVNRTTGAYYLTSEGQLYTSDVFLRGMIGIDPLDIPVYQDDIDYYIENYVSVGSSTWDSTKTYYKGQYNEGDIEPSSYILVESSSQPPGWPTDYYTKEGYKLITPTVNETITDPTWIREVQYNKWVYDETSWGTVYDTLYTPGIYTFWEPDETEWSTIWDTLYTFGVLWEPDEAEWPNVRDSLYIYDNENDRYIRNTNSQYNSEIQYYIFADGYVLNDDDTYHSNIIYHSFSEGYMLNIDDIYHNNITYYIKNFIYHPILIDQYYKHGINDTAHGYIFWDGNFNDPLVPIDQMVYNFSVNQDGDVYARNLTLGDKLKAESVSLEAELKVGNIIITSENKGLITNSDTWWIDGEGFAQFRNAKITGTLSTVAFEKESVSSVGGTLCVAPSQVLENDLIGTPSGDKYKFVLNRNMLYDDAFGIEWDTVKKLSITYIGENAQGETAEITEKDIVLNHEEDNKIWFLFPVSTLRSGTIFISTDTNTSSIVLSASDRYQLADNTEVDYGPHIIMRGPSGEGYRGDKIVIGDLTQHLLNTSFSNVPAEDRGAGLYANNVFLEGHFYLPNAGMTNIDDGKNGNNIRIWAGASPTDRYEAPFRVTQDGTLYASKGVFKGTIEATDSTFSGWLKTAGILVDDDPTTRGEGKQEDSFYVAYSQNRTKPDFPSRSDLILKIDGDGLAVWEGGFKIYTDSYDTQLPSYIYKFYIALTQFVVWEANKYYKLENNQYILLTSEPSDWEQNYSNYYIAGINDKCIPYIQSIEDLTGSNYRLLTSKLQVAAATYQNERNQFYDGIKITENRIDFQHLDNSNDEQSANSLWESNSLFSIQQDNSVLKFMSTATNYIELKSGLDEEFLWSAGSGSLDMGITGSLNVKGLTLMKSGAKIGTGLVNGQGSYIWFKEYNKYENGTRVDELSGFDFFVE